MCNGMKLKLNKCCSASPSKMNNYMPVEGSGVNNNDDNAAAATLQNYYQTTPSQTPQMMQQHTTYDTAALNDGQNNNNNYVQPPPQTNNTPNDDAINITNNDDVMKAPVVSNDTNNKSDELGTIDSIGSWDDDDDNDTGPTPTNNVVETAVRVMQQQGVIPTPAINHNAKSANVPAPIEPIPVGGGGGAAASYENRNQHMPRWMNNINTHSNNTAVANNTSYVANHHHYDPEPNPLMNNNSSSSRPEELNSLRRISSSQSSFNNNNSSSYYQQQQQRHSLPSDHHHHYNHHRQSSSPSYYSQNQQYYHQNRHGSSSTSYSQQQQQHSYHDYHHHHHHHHYDAVQQQQQHQKEPIEIPPEHTPTWQHILPLDYFKKRKEERLNQYNRMHNRRRFTLSLINLWEFTLTTESIDIYGQSSEEVFNGLRGPIKKIAKDHIGRDGRKGAIFERGAGGEGIMPDDPSLKQATAGLSNTNEDGSNSSAIQGKWRIPLGAYQALFTYLTREGHVEGIPPEQLKAATLGRERADKKEYPSVKSLLDSGVSPVIAKALAPYQRGGVEFIIEKEGKALLADEMGLGKTIQAIASMSAFKNDWPLLVLCPSTARYHWETEFRHWMGRESQTALTSSNANDCNPVDNNNTNVPELRHSQINVLTSGKDRILKSNGSTKVVICSIGLIVNLINSQRITPGMFKAVIVDESHMLKNKSTKRTKAVLPLLDAAERCLLLSGTPALAKPSELWPQLSVLGGKNEDGGRYPSGIMCDYEDFMSKYVRAHSKTRLAELHTLLTSTVMIRRMKSDMLKNLPPKLREKAFISIEDQKLKSEFAFYLRMLKEGKGLLGRLAKKHAIGSQANDAAQYVPENGEELKNKEVLHHLYNLSGRCKVARITKMLKNWIADPTKGKLCIFAHHLYVLDELARGAGLSNFIKGHCKFIRIDGSTSPKSRQEQILQFQTDPTVRIALLGITAAGVAVTLTASSTVWFAELFWTPAIMVQAEDRCHRIGQQSNVRCLYFIAKGTLDEVLWKLIEKKFRDLGEFVEGKENMGIALERELEDDEEDEILKVEEEDPDEAATRKRKAENLFDDLLDTDDLEIKAEIDELVHEEEEMLLVKGEVDDDSAEGRDTPATTNSSSSSGEPVKSSNKEAICLLDDDDDEEEKEVLTFAVARQRVDDRITHRIDPAAQLVSEKVSFREVQYPPFKPLGLLMVSFSGRVVIKGYTSDEARQKPNVPQIGSIIVAANGTLIPQNANFNKVLEFLRRLIMNGATVELVFAEEPDFMPWFEKVIMPRYDAQIKASEAAKARKKNDEVIEID